MTDLHVLLNGKPVALAPQPIKSGGQAAVYPVLGNDRLVVKIYHEPPDVEQGRRLERMLTMRPLLARPTHKSQLPELAWPTDLARSPDGALLGYAMPRFGEPGHVQLVGLLNRSSRLRLFPEGADWRFLLGVSWNLAFMTTRMHRENLVIGDFSSNNVVVDGDGFVTFLDCDSIAFTDMVTTEHFPCLMQTAEYCSPERQQGAPATKASDDFALAVLIYQLLTAGNHPFGGVPHDSDSESTVKDNISARCSYVVQPDRVVVPRGIIDPSVLPPALLTLAHAAFGPDAENAGRRPEAADWLQALEQERAGVQVCGTWPQHTYGSHLTACPWCARAADTGQDLFVGTPAHGGPPVPATATGSRSVLIVAVLILLVAVVILLVAHT
jgi:DNA-binding helix-hairpin-helix protein with protein kinase domain